MTGRKVPEWIGKTPDTKIPPRVILRVLEAYGGKCAETGVKIRAGGGWQMDHIIALANGGENRETNLQPLITVAHKEKTAGDVAQKAKDRRVKSKHLSIHKPKSIMAGSKASKWKRKVDGTVVLREK